MIVVKTNAQDVSLFDFATKGWFTKRDVKALVAFIDGAIKHRTQNQGTDIHGNTFGDYSTSKGKKGKRQSYLEYRLEHGRSSRVDLTLTGKMLGTMQVHRNQSNKEQIKFSFGPSMARWGRNTSPGKSNAKGQRPPNSAIAYFIHTGRLGRRGRSGPVVQRPPRHFLGLDKKQQKDFSDVWAQIVARSIKRKAKKA